MTKTRRDRILVVDDEQDARELLAAAFTQMGATVALAGNAAEALVAVRREAPHVLVSDIGMPGEDGYSLIRRVRGGESGASRLPAVALTAYATQDDVKRALTAGYDVHVAKPVNAAHLGRIVAQLVDGVPRAVATDHTARLVLSES